MGQIKNIKDLKFGRLTVIEFEEIKNHHAMWLCKCECGNEIIVSSNSLSTGKTKSCGCYKKELTIKRSTKHNLYNSRIYISYYNMKRRCYNKNHDYYKDYGGRGIKVCDEWLGKNGFITFYKWAINNGYKEGLTIDRINVNGNYEPGNCRWTTIKEQAINKRNNHLITYNNKTYTMREWADILNMSYSAFSTRIYRGWDIEKAIKTSLKVK